MKREEYYSSCDVAIEQYAPVLKAMFPDFQVSRLAYWTCLGKNLTVDIYSPFTVTKHNAKTSLSFIMHMNGKDTEEFALENLNTSKKYRFRKIKGKTPLEVIEKFMKWIESRQEMILSDYAEKGLTT